MKVKKLLANFSKPNDATEVDPLYVIFEQKLYDFYDPSIERPVFLNNVVQDYVQFLRKKGLIIPQIFLKPLEEELAAQVNSMLLKTIYGFSSVNDFLKLQPSKKRREVRSRYKALVGKPAPRRPRSTPKV